jgi:hypothetical protein
MKTLIVSALILASTAAYACRQWSYTTTYGGRTVTCLCTDCGFGPNCNCF